VQAFVDDDEVAASRRCVVVERQPAADVDQRSFLALMVQPSV
jgi:hypothetical protein